MKQKDNFFANIEFNIRQQAKALGITLADLSKYIEMTEAGFYKMLSTGSIKVKTLKKISEVLKMPVTSFFESQSVFGKFDDSHLPYYSDFQVAEPATGYNTEKENLIKQIHLLESQLKDKEKIIELLSKEK